MTVKLKDKIIENWTDYIYTKFNDQSIYEIKKQEDDRGILVKSKTNKTTIWFYINDDNTLYECQYQNEDCKGWSSETISENSERGIFNQANIDALNSILQTPIENGWISIDYYLNGTFYKSKTYFDQNKNSRPFQSLNTNIGCLFLVLFPFFWLVGKLIDLGVIGQKNEIVITPIETPAH